MSEWQPIETAPKKDVLFLGWTSEGYAEVWSGEMFHESLAEGAPLAFPREEAAKLTHWMPLPEGPK